MMAARDAPREISQNIPRGWILAFILVFLLACIIATFPIRLFLSWSGAEDRGLSARQVSGSLWSSRLDEVQIGSLNLGRRLEARLSPLGLFAGRMEIRVAGISDGQSRLVGRIRLGSIGRGGERGVTALSGTIFPARRFDMVQVDMVHMENVEALFDEKEQCRTASGRIKIQVSIAIVEPRLTESLSGALRCNNGRLEARLISQSGQERLIINTDASGQYQMQLVLNAEQTAIMADVLIALGFRDSSDTFVLERTGQFVP